MAAVEAVVETTSSELEPEAAGEAEAEAPSEAPDRCRALRSAAFSTSSSETRFSSLSNGENGVNEEDCEL